MFGTDFIINAISNHPEEILLWTHGFFVALALRRGRVQKLLDTAIPIDPRGEGESGADKKNG